MCIIVTDNGSRSIVRDALEDADIDGFFRFRSSSEPSDAGDLFDFSDGLRILHDSGDQEDEFNEIADAYGLTNYRYFFMNDRESNIDSWTDSDLGSGSNYELVDDDGDNGATDSNFRAVTRWLNGS